MPHISLSNIKKQYSKKGDIIVDNFNLEIKDSEFIVFVGPSGCGKSTILRMIAGLEDISDGELYIDNKKMNDVDSKNRDMAMVFQNYALYPHMSVFDNMAFGLKLRKTPKKNIKEKVLETSEILNLENYLDIKPKGLSGGQRQRVALGRAIVRDASIFLMDEPLSNLDAKLRVQMRSEIIRLHKHLNTTTIYVTHDQTEALTMANRIVILNRGKIMQVGTPKEVYDKPENIFVAGFIGSPSMNILDAYFNEDHIIIEEQKFPITPSQIRLLKEKGYENKNIKMGIRPEHIKDEPIYTESGITNTFEAKVKVNELLGSESIIHTNLGDYELVAKVNSRNQSNSGDTIKFIFDINKIHFFNPETGDRIK
ncbi:ABC transporter ATP-binding protein [Staphylococcus sp. NAM3COL9]|uniref:ABC transporter ATP-binding protein n=1 Tax=Staphylococcus sp. NAM3COL9 TaxID=1667172 RepID=UPI00070C4EF9|nr:sn-glycerol-3-phosphate ABC transporter ATP-binding protein UgpC [Staphylococcus sp. NAM3COL9]KRG10801.1 sugar ABC transporter ATP-binding protein [Staphylococcus sp. NAM3COL9]